jgi:hypothetical protein
MKVASVGLGVVILVQGYGRDSIVVGGFVAELKGKAAIIPAHDTGVRLEETGVLGVAAPEDGAGGCVVCGEFGIGNCGFGAVWFGGEFVCSGIVVMMRETEERWER